jgi:hypothetical protein
MSDLTKLLAAHWWDEGNMGVCECGEGFAHWNEWAVHINALIAAEYLVVPRSDIVGTEYGMRYTSEEGRTNTWSSNTANRAETIRLAESDGSGRVAAMERPILPWSPIPLPEDTPTVESPKCPNPACRNGELPPPRELQGYAEMILCPDCNPRPPLPEDGDTE